MEGAESIPDMGFLEYLMNKESQFRKGYSESMVFQSAMVVQQSGEERWQAPMLVTVPCLCGTRF
jgi:hypothetical protein